MKDFGQRRLNGATKQSAAKRGPSLPHFEHIVCGALMPLCSIAVVFEFLCKRLVGWLVSPLLVGWSTIRVPGLWEISLQKDKKVSQIPESHIEICGSWPVKASNSHMTTHVFYIIGYTKCT
jgi:hypothetical protein